MNLGILQTKQVSIMLETFEHNIPPIIYQLPKKTTCVIT